jgi:hypothetical protein
MTSFGSNLTKFMWLGCCLILTNNAFAADLTWGIGLTWVPSSGVAVGAKVFSDDEEDSPFGSLAIDYFVSGRSKGSWRPSLGLGYQGRSAFVDANVGLTSGELDWGISVGYVENQSDPAPIDPGCCITAPD